jgi:hypothetical protein
MKPQEDKTILFINKVPFRIDHKSLKLTQWNNSANSIDFGVLGKERENGFVDFDKMLKTVVRVDNHFANSENTIKVFIPGVITDEAQLDQKSVKDRLNELSSDNNWGIFLGDRALAERLAGILPQIEIAGTNYIVDWRLKELRQDNAPHEKINLKTLTLSDDGEYYQFFYNVRSKTVYTTETTITALPENVVMLEIPNELKLDPVGVARQYEMDDFAMLLTHPYRSKLSAIVHPLSKTGLPDLVERNLKNKQQEKKNTPRRKRGRGL